MSLSKKPSGLGRFETSSMFQAASAAFMPGPPGFRFDRGSVVDGRGRLSGGVGSGRCCGGAAWGAAGAAGAWAACGAALPTAMAEARITALAKVVLNLIDR